MRASRSRLGLWVLLLVIPLLLCALAAPSAFACACGGAGCVGKCPPNQTEPCGGKGCECTLPAACPCPTTTCAAAQTCGGNKTCNCLAGGGRCGQCSAIRICRTDNCPVHGGPNNCVLVAGSCNQSYTGGCDGFACYGGCCTENLANDCNNGLYGLYACQGSCFNANCQCSKATDCGCLH